MIQWWLLSIAFWAFMSFFNGLMEADSNPFGNPASAVPQSCSARIADDQSLSIIMQGDIMSLNQIDLFFTEVEIPWVNTCFVKAVSHIGTANFSMFDEDSSHLNIIRVIVLLSLTAVTILTLIVFIFPVIIQAVFTVRSIFRI